MTNRKRAFLVILALLGASIWFLYASLRHQQDNIALIAAIQNKDVAGVKALLNRGADPNSTETFGPPPSVWQLFHDFLDRLRGKSTQPKQEGPSALVLAVESDQAEIVTLLLKKGAIGVNARIVTREPLVMYAARTGNTTILRALIDKGADVNARDAKETTALFVARDAVAATLLIDHGADVNAEDAEGDTALKEQMLFNRLPVVGVLLDRGARADGVMHDAVCLHTTDAVKFLLDKGVSPDTRRWFEEPPLLAAITNNHEVIARLLIQRGANVNCKGDDGTTPLMEVAEEDLYPENEEEAQNLLKRLLDHGANINAQDNEGTTALMVAAERGQPILLKVLLQNGADVNARDDEGRTVLSRVAASDLLANQDEDNYEIVGLLLEHGASVNAQDVNGVTPLMRVAQHGDLIATRMLLSSGAGVNAQDHDGWTALMYAACDLRKAVVKELLRHHARVNTRSNDKKTVMDVLERKGVVALSFDEHRTRLQIYRLLIRAGARE